MKLFQHPLFQRLLPVSFGRQDALKRWRVAHLVAGTGAIASLSVLAVPEMPNIPRNRFDNCTADLLKLNISVEEATHACARAFDPGDLGRCVTKVRDRLDLSGEEILNACRQVRRPMEMAECVSDIRRNLNDAAPAEILNNCRITLLPDRYAKCVRGLVKSASITPTQAMDTCNNGGYLPRQIDPTFIPYTSASPQPEPAPMPPAVVPSPVPQPVPAPAPKPVVPQRY